MSERNTAFLLFDIQTAISKILNYTAGMDFHDYESDIKNQGCCGTQF